MDRKLALNGSGWATMSIPFRSDRRDEPRGIKVTCTSDGESQKSHAILYSSRRKTVGTRLGVPGNLHWSRSKHDPRAARPSSLYRHVTYAQVSQPVSLAVRQ